MTVVFDVVEVVDGSALRLTREQGCKAVSTRANSASVVGELMGKAHRAAGICWLINGEMLGADFAAELPCIAARNQREGVGELECLLLLDGR